MNDDEVMGHAIRYGSVAIGTKSGHVVYASAALLGQKGLTECRRMLGLMREFPVRTNLGGGVVMVEANSHEEAIEKWLNRSVK